MSKRIDNETHTHPHHKAACNNAERLGTFALNHPDVSKVGKTSPEEGGHAYPCETSVLIPDIQPRNARHSALPNPIPAICPEMCTKLETRFEEGLER